MPALAEPKAPTKSPILTLGALIDKSFDLREKKRAAEAVVKSIEVEIEELEQPIFDAADAQGLDQARGKKASLSISTATVCNVLEWTELWPWIAKTKNFHLVQKRISDPAYRELLELGRKMPGTQPFEKRRLNLRSLTA